MADTADIEAAVLDTLSDCVDGMVHSFVCMASFSSADGEARWLILEAPEQVLSAGMGMATALSLYYERRFNEAMDEEEDDGDG